MYVKDVSRMAWNMVLSTPGCLIGKYNGADFLIVRGWDVIERVMYRVLEEVCPDAIDRYYVPCGRIAGHGRKTRLLSGSLAVGQQANADGIETPPSLIPQEVTDVFVRIGIPDPSFGGILGVDWGFSDEWACCDRCPNVFRITPDGPGWRPDFLILLQEGERICSSCVTDHDLSQYLGDITNDPRRALNTAFVDDATLDRIGYVKVLDDLEAGMGEWCHDDPTDVMERARAEMPGDYVYVVTSEGPFDVGFSLWRRVGTGNLSGEYCGTLAVTQ